MGRTFIMVKPDGVQRRLIGEVVNRFERRGLKLVALKLLLPSRELAARHYAEHQGKKFYESLLQYITSGPVAAMVWEGPDAVAVGRSMLGATDPRQAPPGTIRGDFGLDIGRNVAHGSASDEDASREIELFFDAGELVDYELCDWRWVCE